MSGAMRIIYKYPMPGSHALTAPVGIVRHVGPQHIGDPLPTFWIEHDDTAAVVDETGPAQEIVLVATGQPFPEDAAWTYIGTAVCALGSLVWHCWSHPAPSPVASTEVKP